jgi:hypothetical protein
MILSTTRTLAKLRRQLSRLDGNLRASFSKLKADLSRQAKEMKYLRSKLIKQEVLNRKLLDYLIVSEITAYLSSTDNPSCLSTEIASARCFSLTSMWSVE